MFTGIIEEVGKVKNINRNGNSTSVIIEAQKVLSDTNAGDSICVNGVCLTVTDIKAGNFSADIMNETLSRSSLNQLNTGGSVNLERAMPLDGRFGGHIVSGHIDGTGHISKIKKDGNAIWFTIATLPGIMKYIIEKGSVALDGISLTIAEVKEDSFSVSVIPHTMENTCLLNKTEKDIVNIENDCIGKYIEKLFITEKKTDKKENNSYITEEFLIRNGF